MLVYAEFTYMYIHMIVSHLYENTEIFVLKDVLNRLHRHQLPSQDNISLGFK